MAKDDGEPLDPASPEMQIALALAAVSIAFAKTLREMDQDPDPLVTLQRNLQVAQASLRQTPGSELVSQQIFRFVRDTLRNPAVLDQPNDDE